MIFRTPDGEFIELNKEDFKNTNEYNQQLMEIYGIKNPTFNNNVNDKLKNIDQVENIYSIIMRQTK
jgi:hypothetical protein